jgi:hypothetical protein
METERVTVEGTGLLILALTFYLVSTPVLNAVELWLRYR